MSDKTLTLGHSPDPDDAFMFFALAEGRIDTRGWTFEHVLRDIQTLNDRARRAELHLTAVSIHAYPYVAKDYALTACGSSMGDGYGPMVVAREPMSVESLRDARIAVPGETTTAILALKLLFGANAFRPEIVPFDRIIGHVADGKADAGLIIHEGQLTYHQARLHKVVDLGEWWKTTYDLPLPLGGNCIRRDLGPASMTEITAVLRESIRYGLAHRAEAVTHSMSYARDMTEKLADQFVGMYVNEWTLDYGEAGRRAVEFLLEKGAEAGIVPALDRLDFID